MKAEKTQYYIQDLTRIKVKTLKHILFKKTLLKSILFTVKRLLILKAV